MLDSSKTSSQVCIESNKISAVAAQDLHTNYSTQQTIEAGLMEEPLVDIHYSPSIKQAAALTFAQQWR